MNVSLVEDIFNDYEESLLVKHNIDRIHADVTGSAIVNQMIHEVNIGRISHKSMIYWADELQKDGFDYLSLEVRNRIKNDA